MKRKNIVSLMVWKKIFVIILLSKPLWSGSYPPLSESNDIYLCPGSNSNELLNQATCTEAQGHNCPGEAIFQPPPYKGWCKWWIP